MLPVTMLLLRHGQSEWNAIHRWQGSANIPLTDLGREQARETAALLGRLDLRFGSVWASDLLRASETASIIADELGLGPVTHDERLREAYAGEWQGMTPAEIERAYPGWLAEHRRPPTFEHFDTVVGRGLDAVRTIADAGNGGTAPLVVAHSGLIRSIIRHLGRADQSVPNLGGVWLMVEDDDVALGELFDPAGVSVSGLEGPGEDPGGADETAPFS
jgi:broad specificity phosphatase PhoE